METMDAVVVADGGLRDELVEIPYPGADDLLVEVQAVSVNPADTKLKLSRSARHRILGYDAAGTVIGMGSAVDGFSVGDAVYYAGDITRPGANARFHSVDARIVGHKPASLSFAEAAAMPLTTITAWESLFEHLRATHDTAGSFVIVGAPGGVGSILTQLARQLTALRVIGTASRPESAEWVRAMGAHDVVDHHDLVAGVRRLVPEGVDALFSSYSEGSIRSFADVLRPFGHIVAIDDAHPDLYPLKSKSITWHWEYMFARSTHRASDVSSQGRLLDEAGTLFDAGILRTTAAAFIDDFSADGIRRAHELVETGRMLGKVVVHR